MNNFLINITNLNNLIFFIIIQMILYYHKPYHKTLLLIITNNINLISLNMLLMILTHPIYKQNSKKMKNSFNHITLLTFQNYFPNLYKKNLLKKIKTNIQSSNLLMKIKIQFSYFALEKEVMQKQIAISTVKTIDISLSSNLMNNQSIKMRKGSTNSSRKNWETNLKISFYQQIC